jgi:hypothetical protein
MRAGTAALMVALVLAASAAPAQEAPPPPAARGEAGVASAGSLPVSLERIRRELARPSTARRDGLLRLDYYVEVYGRAPKLELFTDVDLAHGAVQYGPPTHQEVLQVITPQEFRTPAPNVGGAVMALVRWLSERMGR